MKVKDLISEDIDIDVCDDYDESCWIAKCGAYKLTDAGEQRFRDALDISVVLMLNQKYPIAILECDDEDEDVAQKNVKACRALFFSLAGYCAADDYDKWFIEK